MENIHRLGEIMPAISSVLGGLLGLGGSIVPAVLEVYDKKQERAHVEKLRGLEIEAAKIGQEFTLKGQEVTADSAEAVALLAHDQSLVTENKWLQALRSSVRPVITYIFFALFLLVKLSALYVAFVVQSVPLAPALLAIWDEDTSAIFAAVIGFWFGARAITKFGYGTSGASVKLPAGVTFKSNIKKPTA
jgi:hypothetical protein